MPLLETQTVMLTLAAGESPRPVEIPLRVESVRIGAKLGEGAAGAVFVGYDESLARRVAVKLLHRAAGAGSAAREELISGVRAAAGLRHPNVVTVHSVGTVGELAYIVMELVEGVSLRQWLAGSPPGAPLALHMMRSLADAVAVLHDQSIVHRDLKPANVLYDRRGEVRLCDFGLACPVSGFGAPGAIAVAGTPLYMAPELFEGQASFASDVYALGVILFELLCGAPPFTAETLTDLKRQHQYREVPLEPLSARGLPAELCEVVVRALHKQRMLRFKTAAHLLRALQALSLPVPAAEHARRALAERVEGILGGQPPPPADSNTAPGMQTTFDLLARRAEQKRAARGDTSADASAR